MHPSFGEMDAQLNPPAIENYTCEVVPANHNNPHILEVNFCWNSSKTNYAWHDLIGMKIDLTTSVAEY